MHMEFKREWKDSRSQRDELIEKYHDKVGGVLLHAVDICQTADECDQQRSANLRISDLESEYRHLDGEAFVHTEEDQNRIRRLIETPGHSVELIEAQDWGYDGFGHIVAKSELLEQFWDISSVDRTIIVDTSTSQPLLRDEPPDDELMEVFRTFDIDVIDGESLEPR